MAGPNKKAKPRGRIKLNFDLTDDRQLAIYRLLQTKGQQRCATSWLMSHLRFELSEAHDGEPEHTHDDSGGLTMATVTTTVSESETHRPTESPDSTISASPKSVVDEVSRETSSDCDMADVSDILSIFGS